MGSMTSIEPALFIGIDALANHRPFSYVALGIDSRPVAMGQGRQAEMLAFLSGQRAAWVGLNGPLRPAAGVMARADVRQNLTPLPEAGQWLDARQCDYELATRGLRSHRVATNAADCPPWMRRGFGIVALLDRLGFQPFPGEGALQYLEVHADAGYSTLMERQPYDAATLEGRMQRQFVLRQQGLNVPDPMDFLEEITPYKLMHGLLPMEQIYSPYILNAWIAAYAAWLAYHTPRRVACLGAPEEGTLVLPLRAE